MKVNIKKVNCSNITDYMVLKLIGQELESNFWSEGLDYEDFKNLDECYLHEMQNTAEELIENEAADYTIEINGGIEGYVTITFELITENEDDYEKLQELKKEAENEEI